MEKLFHKTTFWLLSGSAKRILSRNKPFIIGALDNSEEKNGIKNILARVLSPHFDGKVFVGGDNMGDSLGIVLSILGIWEKPSMIFWPWLIIRAIPRMLNQSYPKLLILSIKTDAEEKRLLETLQIDSAVINRLPAEKEIGDFGILGLVKKDGKIFINADEPSNKYSGRKIAIGIESEKVDYRAENISLSGPFSYRISALGHNIAVKSKVEKKQEIYAELLAFAVGQTLGIQSLQVKKLIEG